MSRPLTQYFLDFRMLDRRQQSHVIHRHAGDFELTDVGDGVERLLEITE